MKNKRKVIWFLLVFMFLLAGCGDEQKVPDPVLPTQDSQEQEDVVTPGGDELSQKDEENNSPVVINPEGTQIDTEKVNQMLKELNAKEKFLTVLLPNEETLLLHCRNRESEECAFYVLCMKEGEESIRPIALDLVGEVECYSYEDYIVLYDTMNHVNVLNHQFELLDEITIPDSINSIDRSMGSKNYCVLPRDRKILYYTTVLANGEFYEGLYETDYECAESTLVYKLEGPETNLNYLNGFDKIYPGYSQEGIFFTGDYFKTIESQSKNCVGYLNLESKELVVHKTDMERMALSAAGAIYCDGYRETDLEYSGELLAIDEAGITSRITTEYFKESERVYCDRYGNILTCYEKENGESVLNLYKGNLWEKQEVVPYNLADFMLLNQGQCMLYSCRNRDGLQIKLQDI